MLWQVAGALGADRRLFDDGWHFCLNPQDTTLYLPHTDDSRWRTLSLPHDWAIEGTFAATHPSGPGGGALPGGIGWYRKHFRVHSLQGRKYFIDFDGAYMNATVWINGHRLGTRPYGYSSFRYDLTPHLRADADNVIAVRVDNSDQPNSRWYSGCGIYRHVWLVSSAPLRIAHWGTHVVADVSGRLTVSVTLDDERPATQRRQPLIRHTVLDAQGRTVARSEGHGLKQLLRVKRPHLWSLTQPYIYRVRTEVVADGQVVDSEETTTGFRQAEFRAQTGFWLNGENIKIKGVCMHHDLGCLGAALNEDALHRQLSIMRSMGANAIRCSHNPPAPELLHMADTMGLLVMDESFDMWHRKKTQNDYARYFDEWHERDLAALLLRDRNHPSVIMWSIGNEVLEQWTSASADTLTLEQANLLLNAGHTVSTPTQGEGLSTNAMLARHLAGIVHCYDTTRPITSGCNEPDPANHLFRSGVIDVIGYNYHEQWVKDVPRNFPGKPFLFAESVSALQSRGVYLMPSDSMRIMPSRWDLPYNDHLMLCSSYDHSHVPWGTTHEQTWDIVKHTPYCAGEFVWTGFDYLGEPTPFGFPARSSYFGIVDLAGFPKDVYYMYQSEWASKPMLHLFPHWTWREGETIDLWCYYSGADEVELLLNGRSLGTRRKADSHQYHVMWRVPFERGEVTAVSRRDGREVARQTLRTAGAPHSVRLTCDYRGHNTLFVRAEVVDSAGTLCPWATDDIHFDVSGGTIIGVDNGSQISTESFKADHRRAFYGKALVVIWQHDASTPVSLSASAATLRTARITLGR